ncbi:MAG: sulfite exporter TauE/SafE family protein [bacterium]
MEALPVILSGFAVGVSLGLTGGGGSLLAVPLLVYGVGQSPHMALGTSLASVGAVALSGALRRMAEGRVAIRKGLLFAAVGAGGTYLGTRTNSFFPGPVLLILLAGLTVLMAVRMWRNGGSGREDGAARKEVRPLALIAAALGAGFASGFFGIGGGFMIVPALVLVAGLTAGTAMATSLLVISINGAVGVVSYAVQGRPIDYAVAAIFAAGGLGGMWLGQTLGGRLDDRLLARVFAAMLMLVAAFLIYKNLWSI